MYSVSPPRKLLSRAEVFYAVPAGLLPQSSLLSSSQLHIQSDSRPTTDSFPPRRALLKISSPRGCQPFSEEPDRAPVSMMRCLYRTTPQGTPFPPLQTVPLLSCFTVLEATLLSSLFKLSPHPPPRAILYHRQLCEAEVAFNLELPKKENKERRKERKSHFFIATSLLTVSITQCECTYYTL